MSSTENKNELLEDIEKIFLRGTDKMLSSLSPPNIPINIKLISKASVIKGLTNPGMCYIELDRAEFYLLQTVREVEYQRGVRITFLVENGKLMKTV